MKTKLFGAIALLCFCSLLFTSCSPATTPNSPTSEATLPEEEGIVKTEETVKETVEPTEVVTTESLPCTIAFQSDRDGNWEIYRMAPDGSDQVNLTNDPGDDFEPAFSPNGSQIAFVSNRGTDGEGGQFIYVMNADGSDVRKLPTEDGSRHPSWAPTGEAILYDNGNDIFIVNPNGNEPSVQLTETPDQDKQPDFSPEDDFILWISGDDNNANIFVMDLRTMEPQQITPGAGVSNAQWTVDAEIFFHGDADEYGCFNCVMAADGTNVRDAGGKGTIQEFLPFWTLDGDRVECVHHRLEEGDDEEIFLVSDIYPDVFLNLTNAPEGDDRSPSWPDLCDPGTEGNPEETVSTEGAEFIIGYEDADGVMTSNQKSDLAQACSELPIACVQDDFDSLIAQEVDAILSFSNKWHVMGSAPQINDATGKEIPVFILNAETDAYGAYNLSNDSDAIRSTLEWMFTEMGGEGDFIYFVFGQNPIHQSMVDQVLAEYPGISATGLPAEYGDDSVTWEHVAALIAENPNLGAIWSDENINQLIIAASGIEQGQSPYIVCDPRDDWLGTWQKTMEMNPLFKCIATINPGGTAYEGVYAAYYLLSGEEISPEALGGLFGNTFLYDYPVITNDNLEDWLGKLDGFRTTEWGTYELAPMTPEQIREAWFIN